ncbi:MAG: aspartate aminotransferase family protein [Clostridiales bacterium]|nr:aspartate aminotransferase family protein [Clostridiales bacterium]
MDLQTIREQDGRYLMPTYGRFPVALEEGHGATVLDGEGKEYVDFGSGIGVNSLGYADPGWAAAVSAQAARLQHASNLYYSEGQAALARRLCQLSGMGRVFLCNSGAEANECAIKLARKYSFDTYGKGRDTILTLQNSFHGRTVTTLAATGQEVFHNFFFPFTEGFDYVPAGNLDALTAKADGSVCAVMIELVQGEGGVRPLEQEYVKALRRFCEEKDILLIVDEVQTGVGRVGSFYAYQQYGILPDIVTSAKGLGGGLPIGACLCAERLGGVMTAGTHGTTYGGNPIACAAAQYVLDRVTAPGFMESVKEKGAYLRSAIEAMPHVAAVRGLGMMLGVELAKGTARQAAEACLEQGLIILTAKEVLRLLPPLTITRQEMDRGLAGLRKVLESL